MTTFAAYRRAILSMLPLGPNTGLGQQYALDGLTTTTATVNTLRVGTHPAERFQNKYVVRADAASAADRQRVCSNFVSSTGVFTHAGTNYSDTTATSEILEVLAYPVEMFDVAIQETLRKLKRIDRFIIPTRQATKRYFLNDLSWITTGKEIEKVSHTTDPTMSNNRFMEHWNSINTSGSIRADNWTLAGSGASYARSSAGPRGQYAVTVTRAGTDCTFSQTVSLLDTGVSNDSLRGRSVTAVGVLSSSVASQARIQVYDGVDTTSSDYHTGGGAYEELTVTHSVNSAATALTFRLSVESDNTDVILDELYLMADQSAARDDVRRDAFPEREIPYSIEQGAGTLVLVVPQMGTPGQLVVYASRAYPQFDSSRVIAGSCEADVNDAPLIPVAVGAIAHLYRTLAETEGPDRARFWQLHTSWEKKFEDLALGMSVPEQGDQRDFGLPFPTVTNWPPARRTR